MGYEGRDVSWNNFNDRDWDGIGLGRVVRDEELMFAILEGS